MIYMNSIVARIEDLPYYYSPPMQITFKQSASLLGGKYVFNSAPEIVGNNKNINDLTMIYIKSLSFSADIDLLSYQKALKLIGGGVDVPRFSLFAESNSNAPLLTDPIQLAEYFSDQEYKKLLLLNQVPNRLTGFFRGSLQQHGDLAGVSDVTLTLNIWMQAITDDNFIKALKCKYPDRIRG